MWHGRCPQMMAMIHRMIPRDPPGFPTVFSSFPLATHRAARADLTVMCADEMGTSR